MYTDVLLKFEFVEIENTKSINDVNYGIYWKILLIRYTIN